MTDDSRSAPDFGNSVVMIGWRQAHYLLERHEPDLNTIN